MNLILDFDSTIIKIEGLDELTQIVSSRTGDAQLPQKVAAITDLGMSGKIGFAESLSRRVALLDFTQQDLEKLISKLKTQVTESLLTEIDRLHQIADRIIVISGGFKDFILPVVAELNIHPENVFANEFVFNDNGDFQGVNVDNLLAHDNGKIKVVRDLDLAENTTVVVGDGFTDYRIKEAGLANKFIAFTGNVTRESVVAVADYQINSFTQLIEILKNFQPDTRTS